MKIGETRVIKTTNEEVFILGIGDGGQEPVTEALGQVITVRRPLLTDKGVIHQIETFYEAELETVEERIQRDYGRQQMLTKQVFGKAAGHVVEMDEDEMNTHLSGFKATN